jgi:GntR family transcriptional regulator/MocR family aminotransferase
MVQGHLARHVRRLRRVYAQRRSLIIDHLRHGMDGWLRPIPGDAGLHITAMLRPGLKAADLAGLALTRRIAVHPVSSASGLEGLALGYGAVDDAGIRRGLDTLGQLLANSA